MNITKEQFLKYEAVRKSGVTNMFDVRMVNQLSGLTRDEILECMQSYNSLYKKYIGERGQS